MKKSTTIVIEEGEDIRVSLGEYEGTTHLGFWVGDVNTTFMLTGKDPAEAIAMLTEKFERALRAHAYMAGKDT